MQAPVSVAMSTMASGRSSAASTIASAITSRPSASVFRTSTVVPPRTVRTSPILRAVPEGMLSVHINQPVTAAVPPSSASTVMAASTEAAPDMSFFIIAWTPSAGLRLMPPESYMIPLPMSASRPVGDSGT